MQRAFHFLPHVRSLLLISILFGFVRPLVCAQAPEFRVGTASAQLEGDDSMAIAGGIGPGKAAGQEGELRAVAVVLERKPVKLALVACDILMITREYLDPVAEEIANATGIPAAHILMNCTHTHHAPSTVTLHGYTPDPVFVKRVQEAIVRAVVAANNDLAKQKGPARFEFALGEENTVGQNSRVMMSDGFVYWTGRQDNFVRPTGPFDPELPVLAFRDSDSRLKALIFNHSTHTIGVRQPGKRSPSFYGIASQELEQELGGTVMFLEGASGSTHNLKLTGNEAADRIKVAVRKTLAAATARPVTRLAAAKRPFRYKVRVFDEAREDEAVSRYCKKYSGGAADYVIQIFRDMRKSLAPFQGEERETWLQVMLIGDVAVAGVPAEFFTKFGLDIKNRSPFRHTYVAELANDWIGYLPDRDGFTLGGYQVWMGHHSYTEPGTGERVVEQITEMLKEVAADQNVSANVK